MNEIVFTNINSLKEMGIHKLTPVISTSAEKQALGITVFRRNIKMCQQYEDCLDCPQFCPCNGIEIDTCHNSDDMYLSNNDVK